MIKDPVCGMPADDKSPLRSLFERQTYRFCSSDCQAKFVREPARYATQTGEKERQEGQL
ncbi:MAG: YHS domain-containing protein [Thermoanaerobaculia bacterium]